MNPEIVLAGLVWVAVAVAWIVTAVSRWDAEYRQK